MRPSDYDALEEAFAGAGVRRERFEGTAERAIRLEGGTVLRFDLQGFYLGATAGDDPFGPLLADGDDEDGATVLGDDEDGYGAVVADGGATVALVPAIASPEPPGGNGARRGAAGQGPGEELPGLLAPGGPVVVEGFGFAGLMGDFSGATSDLRLIELWLERKSAESKRAYVADLVRFFSVISEDLATGEIGVRKKALREITLSDLHEFAAVIAGIWSERTQLRMLSTVKSLFSFAHRVGYLPRNVGAAVELPGVKDDLAERELSEEDVRELVRAPITPPWRDGRPDPKWKPGPSAYRDHVILLTLYAGGLRREDVCNLKWRDVKSRDDVARGSGQITVFGKGRKTGNVLLPASVFRKMLELRQGAADAAGEATGPEDPVFRSRKKKTGRAGHLSTSQIYRIVKAAAKDAGLQNAENVSPHWLRHAHATHADRKGAPIGLIRQTLRHSSIATTGHYLQANPTESSAMYLGL